MSRFLLLLALIIGGAACGVHEVEMPGDFSEQRNVGEFLTLFGTVNADGGSSIIQTSDDGLLIAGEGNGTIAPADGTISNLMITRLNKSGKVLWSKLLPPRGFVSVNTAIENFPSEYIVLFYQYPNLTLLKLDGFGQLAQNKLYERSGYVYGDHLLQKISDGEYLLAGEYSKSETEQGSFLVKVNSRGNVIWSKEFDRSLGFARSVLATSHGFIVICVKLAENEGKYNTDLVVFKTDQDGALLWSKTLGNSDADERGRSIAATNDGGFVVAGQTANAAFFMKLDGMGNLQWLSNLQTGDYSMANSVAAGSDGFLYTGSTGRDVLVGKTDLQGNSIWIRRINPRAKHGWGNSITRLHNGKFAITGSYGEGGGYGGGEYDAFLLIIDNNGNFETGG